MIVPALELQIGDVVDVWWQPGSDTVIDIKPYRGRYMHEPKWKGCKTVIFGIQRTGMTIFPSDQFEVN